MAAYAVTDYVSTADTVEQCAAALETKLETIDNSKTIRYIDILQLPDNTYQAILIYDA